MVHCELRRKAMNLGSAAGYHNFIWSIDLPLCTILQRNEIANFLNKIHVVRICVLLMYFTAAITKDQENSALSSFK
jgi:hypothetical protein